MHEDKPDELMCEPCEDQEDSIVHCKLVDPVAAGDVEGEVEQEAERQRPVTDPGQPTQDERDEHDCFHRPFRPWCSACVRARAKDAPSRK